MPQFLNNPELQRILSTFIVGRMKELGCDYKPLSAELLEQYGVEQSPGNLKSKIYRGNFNGTLFLILYWVLGIDQHTMDRARAIYQKALDLNGCDRTDQDDNGSGQKAIGTDHKTINTGQETIDTSQTQTSKEMSS